MKLRVLFTTISVILIISGSVSIITGVSTSSTKLGGIVTLTGVDATWSGMTAMLIGLLPLIVWLPKRYVGLCVIIWWVGLMSWLFTGIFMK